MNTNYRSYLKVQELFAKVGGLFNAFYLIIKLILYEYVRFKFRVDYAEYTIDAVDLEKNKNLFPEIDDYKKSYFNMMKVSNSNLVNIKNDDKDVNTNKIIPIKENEDSKKNSNSNLNNSNKNNNIIQLRFSSNQMNSINHLVNHEDNNKNNDNTIMNKINSIKTNNFVKESFDLKKTTENVENKLILEQKNKDNNGVYKHTNLYMKTRINPLSLYINNLKLKEDINLKTLNEYLLEKGRKSNFFSYFFSDFCGCCYNNKPVSTQIINSEYSRVK